MSASFEQRVFRWGAWFGVAERDGWKVIGFTHQCGAATLVDFGDGYDGTCCSGCRFEIQRPANECTPLYQPSEAQ